MQEGQGTVESLPGVGRAERHIFLTLLPYWGVAEWASSDLTRLAKASAGERSWHYSAALLKHSPTPGWGWQVPMVAALSCFRDETGDRGHL